jgi:hypothetical protein
MHRLIKNMIRDGKMKRNQSQSVDNHQSLSKEVANLVMIIH